MRKLNTVLYIILLASGILGLTDTIALLFYTNMNVGTLLPGAAGFLLVIYAYLKLWVYKGRPLVKNRILKNLVFTGITLLVISFFSIEALIIYNSSSQQDVPMNYMIILGAGVKGETVSLTLKRRLDKGLDYLNQYPYARVIVSGGKGFEEDISEAEAMRRYLVKKGIREERIIMEDKATSTMENFMYSKRLLSNINSENVYDIMIVTNDFHMMRAKMLARRNGFQPYGITCSTPAPVIVNSYIREYFAFVKSYFLDK